MDRRQAINRVALIMGATMISTELFLSCKNDTTTSNAKASSLNGSLADLIGEIGHTILPQTDKHPGFKAINGQQVTINILEHCYKKEDLSTIIDGLNQLETDTKKKYNKNFTALSDQEKFETINTIDKTTFDKATKPDKPTYYNMIKEAILLTYFSDKAVMEGVFSYKKVPGKYDGAMKTDANSNSVIYGLGV